MRVYFRRFLLITAFVAFSLVLPFYPVNGLESQVTPTQTHLTIEQEKSFPVSLIIPAINVNANIQHIGVNLLGEMEVPSNAAEVGWFKLGSRPGEQGSAVISGHLDGKNGEASVFANLNKLKKGDKLYIEDSEGRMTSFVVLDSRIYDSGYAEEVFSKSNGAYLNLITCDGIWDGAEKSYSKRLVVFTGISTDSR